MRKLALCLLLAACTEPAVEPPRKTPEAVQPRPVVDEVRALDLSHRTPKRAQAVALSERWLIILDSEGDAQKRASRLKKLASLDLPSAPSTLSSTEFKGLMPCYDVLIAQHFADRKAAIAYSKKLTAAGVGNYPKNAGKYVGKQPAVEAYCEAGAAGGSCGDGLFLAVEHAGKAWVHLGLDAIAQERALAKAPAPTGGPASWEQPLTAVKLGGLKKGDKITALASGGETRACTVEGFAALTRGTPHFSSYASKKPTCGEPEIFARLNCAGDGVIAAFSRAVEVAKPEGAQKLSAAFVDGGALERAGQAHAREQGKPLQLEERAEVWRAGKRTWERGERHLFTGEGFDECGGPDFDVTVSGWADGDKVLRPLEAGYLRKTLGVVVTGGEPLEIFEQHFGDRGMARLTGEALCSLPKPFCDCGC